MFYVKFRSLISMMELDDLDFVIWSDDNKCNFKILHYKLDVFPKKKPRDCEMKNDSLLILFYIFIFTE